MKRAWLAAISAVLLLLTVIVSSTGTTRMAAAADTFGFITPAFQQVWTRTDDPRVQNANSGRSYIWGPAPRYYVHEAYADSPNGDRQVQYFDKSRMEVNQPYSKPYSAGSNKYYVTNGLLVREMIRGCIALGDSNDAKDCRNGSADIPLSGDIALGQGVNPTANNKVSPTYTSLQNIASLNNDKRSDRAQNGALVTATLAKNGAVGSDNSKGNFNVRIVNYEDALGHNVPDVFINYINKTGPLINTDTGNNVFNGQVIDKLYSFGYAISDPYWTRSVVAGRETDVLMQAFERRILTYEPGAPEAYRVQMGNVGLAYYQWRYGGTTTPSSAPTTLFRKAYVNYDGKLQNVGFGINAYTYYNNTTPAGGTMRDFVASNIKDLGARWVRIQVPWAEVQPENNTNYRWDCCSGTGLESNINTMYANQIHVLVSVVNTPDWANPIGRDDKGNKTGLPADPNTYGNFLKALATHFGNKIDAYEMWNEENLSREVGNFSNPTNPDVSSYANLLRAGYNGVKIVNPFAIVVLGSLTPTADVSSRAIDDVQYLKKLLAYRYSDGDKTTKYFDVVGAHSGSQNNDADQKWPDSPGQGIGPSNYNNNCIANKDCWKTSNAFYFRRVEDIHQAIIDSGDTLDRDNFTPLTRQIWLTEFGWDTNENGLAVGQRSPRVDSYEYADVNTEADQAQRVARAYQRAQQNYPWMGVMMAWNLNYSTIATGNLDEKIGWSFLRKNGTQRPVYGAYKALDKGR